MRSDRCAGGHNFVFDTDVCTRCGIDRRQYRDGGNPECVPRHREPIVTTATWQMRYQVDGEFTMLASVLERRGRGVNSVPWAEAPHLPKPSQLARRNWTGVSRPPRLKASFLFW
jgi:hypothetical protein